MTDRELVDFEIAAVSAEDIPVLRSINGRAMKTRGMPEEIWTQYLERSPEFRVRALWLVEAGGEEAPRKFLAGFTICHFPPVVPKDGVLLLINVSPEHSSRGFGTALLAEATQAILSEDRQPCLMAEFNNRKLIGFYGGRGYRQVGEPFDLPGAGLQVRLNYELLR